MSSTRTRLCTILVISWPKFSSIDDFDPETLVRKMKHRCSNFNLWPLRWLRNTHYILRTFFHRVEFSLSLSLSLSRFLPPPLPSPVQRYEIANTRSISKFLTQHDLELLQLKQIISAISSDRTSAAIIYQSICRLRRYFFFLSFLFFSRSNQVCFSVLALSFSTREPENKRDRERGDTRWSNTRFENCFEKIAHAFFVLSNFPIVLRT